MHADLLFLDQILGRGHHHEDGRGNAIEFDRKRIHALGMWQNQSRGLKIGSSLSRLYELPTRTNENYNELTALHSGITFASIEPLWDVNDTYYFVQEDPLPASLLGVVVEGDVGDDDD